MLATRGRPGRPYPPAVDSRADELLSRECDPAYRRRALWLLEALELKGGTRLLDAGCGTGTYLRLAAELSSSRAVGVDRDACRLAEARAARVSTALASGDLLHLPFRAASFDRVLASEVLEHVEDDRRALSELRRVLVPGGILAVSVPHADFPFWWDPVGAAREAAGAAPLRSGPLVGIWWGHLRLYRPRELATAVSAAGLRVEMVEEATHHAFPFSHLLLYGVGKPLLEKGLLPDGARRSATRLPQPGESPPPAWRDPVAWAREAMRLIDRRNERPARVRPGTFVNVLLKARRPI